MLGMDLRKAPVDDELRMLTDTRWTTSQPLSHCRDDLVRVGRSRACVGRTCACRRRVAARRRRICGRVLDLRRGALVAGRCRARGLARRQPAQVAARAGGLLTSLDCAADEFRQAFSLVPEYLRTPEDAYALSEYGPALGRGSAP